MKFEWDEKKRIRNIEKHGLDFNDAHQIFTDEAYVVEDARINYDETRYVLYGPLFGRIVVAAFTVREDVIRIISMRKANKREQASYFQKRSESN